MLLRFSCGIRTCLFVTRTCSNQWWFGILPLGHVTAGGVLWLRDEHSLIFVFVAQFLPWSLLFLLFSVAWHMLIQRGERIFSILGVRSFLAARLYYCYLVFSSVWAEPRLIVLLSKIIGGGLWCHDLRRSTSFWPTRVFCFCSWCLFMLTRFTCRNREKFYMSCFQLTRAPEGRC